MDEDAREWKLYERYVAKLMSEHQSNSVTVAANVKLKGCITGIRRQIDVLIDARVEEDASRRTIVEAKRWKRKVDVKAVEAFEGMMRDCRAHRGILVSSSGFTPAAERRAQDSISVRLVSPDDLSLLDLTAWEPCVGTCANRKSTSPGLVLYDQPIGFTPILVPVNQPHLATTGPLYVVVVGKCDRCKNFHLWCWNCGARFALRDNDEFHCGCPWFWLTAVEEEGEDDFGNTLKAVLLIYVSLPTGIYKVVDRRPLN